MKYVILFLACGILFHGCMIPALIAMGRDEISTTADYKIGKYRVKQKSGQGWAGPRYYYYILDKKGVARIFFKKVKSHQRAGDDPCFVSFKSKSILYEFDLCKKKLKCKVPIGVQRKK